MKIETRNCLLCNTEFKTDKWNKVHCSYQCARKRSELLKYNQSYHKLSDEDQELMTKMVKE